MQSVTQDFLTNIQKIRNDNLDITYCEWFDETSNIWAKHSHNHPKVIEMIYFRTGKAKISVSSELLAVSLYDVIIYPEGAYHHEMLYPYLRQEIICIRVKIEGGIEIRRPILLKDRDQSLNWLFQKVYNEFKKDESEFSLAIDYARILLITCLLYHINSIANDNFLDLVIGYLHDHFNEKITISQIADIVHLSEAYISRSFKKKYGTSIIKYINLLRIEAAMHMLVSTEDPVEVIAVKVGFDSPKYFCRAFKERVGVPPTSFRLQNR